MFAGGRGGVNSRGGGYSGGGAISRGGGSSGGVNGDASDDQSSRDTGSNSLGVGGHGTGLAEDVGGVGGASGGVGAGDGSGLNPNRIRGFGVQQAVGGRGGGRLETPTLNEMKAKQGAIVAKFMTFFRRKTL